MTVWQPVRPTCAELIKICPNMANDTVCSNDVSHVPTTSEYKDQLGWVWIMLVSAGTIITLTLYSMFFEQVYFTLKHAHKQWRSSILWVTSIYSLMALMSLLSIIVPQAHDICTAVKVTFMCIGISHFTDLTLLMFGGQTHFLNTYHDHDLSLQVSPLCCCCKCLPTVPVNRKRVEFVLILVRQMPFTQAIYTFLHYYIIISSANESGDIDFSSSFLWLSIFNLVSFLSGVYALNLLADIAGRSLDNFRYQKKSTIVRKLVMVTKLQSFIFDIMAHYGAFPCKEPILTPQIYKQTVENGLYLLEVFLLGIFSFILYHNSDEFKERPQEDGNHKDLADARAPPKKISKANLNDVITNDVMPSSFDNSSLDMANEHEISAISQPPSNIYTIDEDSQQPFGDPLDRTSSHNASEV